MWRRLSTISRHRWKPLGETSPPPGGRISEARGHAGYRPIDNFDKYSELSTLRSSELTSARPNYKNVGGYRRCLPRTPIPSKALFRYHQHHKRLGIPRPPLRRFGTPLSPNPPTCLSISTKYAEEIARASLGTRPHLCRSRGPRQVHHLRPYRIQVPHTPARSESGAHSSTHEFCHSPRRFNRPQIPGILPGICKRLTAQSQARLTRTRIILQLRPRRIQPCLRDWQRAPELRDSPPEFPDYSQGCPAGDGI